MLRSEFHRDLQLVQDELLMMASMVEKAIGRSVDALKNRDLQMAEEVIREDDIIDDKQHEIEEKCIDLIATQQPMAGDLRTIVTVIHLASELERMGDYAEGIAKICRMMGDEPPLKPLIDIPRMAERWRPTCCAAASMPLSSTMWILRLKCAETTDEIDALYEQVYRELLTFMLGGPPPLFAAPHTCYGRRTTLSASQTAPRTSPRMSYTWSQASATAR